MWRSIGERRGAGEGWDGESKDEKAPRESFRPLRYLLCHRDVRRWRVRQSRRGSIVRASTAGATKVWKLVTVVARSVIVSQLLIWGLWRIGGAVEVEVAHLLLHLLPFQNLRHLELQRWFPRACQWPFPCLCLILAGGEIRLRNQGWFALLNFPVFCPPFPVALRKSRRKCCSGDSGYQWMSAYPLADRLRTFHSPRWDSVAQPANQSRSLDSVSFREELAGDTRPDPL